MPGCAGTLMAWPMAELSLHPRRQSTGPAEQSATTIDQLCMHFDYWCSGVCARRLLQLDCKRFSQLKRPQTDVKQASDKQLSGINHLSQHVHLKPMQRDE
jgi:hypothetical protein